MARKTEFDSYAADYRSVHARNIRITGEGPEYFARYKVELLARLCRQHEFSPHRIVDFGTGIGASLPHLAREFPQARIVGTDVSARSLDFARQYESTQVEILLQDGPVIPVADGSVDVVFVACVLHHVPPAERPPLLRQLARLLRPGGWVCVFEHNPWNPLTRHAVSTCVLDTNAVLLSLPETSRLLTGAGFTLLDRRFTLFFPHLMRALRPLEEHLALLPVGGQYVVVGAAKSGDAHREEQQ